MTLQNFLNYEVLIPEDKEQLIQALEGERVLKNNKGVGHYNCPCALDIETSSFYHDGDKVAIMYEWTLGINGQVMIGRTWAEFENVLRYLSDALNLNEKKKLIIYVHNLSYEFQFIRKHFSWDRVFALEARKPLIALTDIGIEFRCSFLLSGYSLHKVGEHLQKYIVEKKTGDLDYDLIRHSGTQLTEREIGYCVNDVRVVMAFIQEEIENNGNILKIPMTKTGYVRKFCRNYCFRSKTERFKRLKYMETIKTLTLDPDCYKQLKRGFQGGFTHANPFYSGRLLEKVSSIDFTSSYPAVLIAERFPMSAPEEIQITSKEDFRKNLRLYCCLFDVEIIGLKSVIFTESYISISRCWNVEKPLINNGRLVSANRIITTVTEQDFFIIEKFYTWDKIRIGNFRRFRKGYLPTDFIKAILKLYSDKTTLKGIAGKETEYMKGKEMLNSCYGMTVTDIIRDNISYTDDWTKTKPDILEEIDKYNNSKSRFLYYPWGVWCTAYARSNLFSGILAFGSDYVYSDTDSIKCLNYDKHVNYIEKYNSEIIRKLRRACKYHGIDYSLISPKTIEDIEKPLGVWDYEGEYDKFKTLGAKRYIMEEAGEINITVSGLNKKVTVPWLSTKFTNPFVAFCDGLSVPEEATGKNTHTYIDELRKGSVFDYRGVEGDYSELSAVHLSGATYDLGLSQEYSDYILHIWED